MDNLRRFDTVIYVLLAVLLGCRHCLEVTQRPSNSTVLQGSQALFNCTVKGEWKSILWFLKGTPVVIIIKATGTTVLHSSFSAVNYTEPNSYTSELIIWNVNISDAGPVACNAFASEYFTAYLSVQVSGTLRITNGTLTVMVNETTEIVCQASGWLPAPHITWLTNNSSVDPSSYVTQETVGSGGLQDAMSILHITPGENKTVTCLASIEALPEPQSATVSLTVREYNLQALEENDNTEVIIIAVVVPIAAVLLLIIIIVIIVVCCRRKQEESSYQSQLKKVSAQRAKDLSTISKSDAWEANHGYDAEQSVNRRHLPNIPSDSSGISSYFDPDKNVGDDSTTEVSDAYNGAFHPGNQYSTSPWKLRHVTHV